MAPPLPFSSPPPQRSSLSSPVSHKGGRRPRNFQQGRGRLLAVREGGVEEERQGPATEGARSSPRGAPRPSHGGSSIFAGVSLTSSSARSILAALPPSGTNNMQNYLLNPILIYVYHEREMPGYLSEIQADETYSAPLDLSYCEKTIETLCRLEGLLGMG